MIWIAVSVAISAVLAQHLGLIEAISDIFSKIAKCPMCTCFWVTLLALIYAKYDLISALTLSIVLAYLSNFFSLLLIPLQKLYNKLAGYEKRKHTEEKD